LKYRTEQTHQTKCIRYLMVVTRVRVLVAVTAEKTAGQTAEKRAMIKVVS
jgi:hypothetical protein